MLAFSPWFSRRKLVYDRDLGFYHNALLFLDVMLEVLILDAINLWLSLRNDGWVSHGEYREDS
jgi:hypothetical protein